MSQCPTPIAQRPTATGQRQPLQRRRDARGRRAFTLTELLVVITLIVLLIVLALPAFNFITGSRSVDGAQNVVGAMLGRARSEAINQQRSMGVAFWFDRTNERTAMAI